MKDRNGIEINVGDMVEWIAEASGVKKPREGKVIELVPAGVPVKTFNNGGRGFATNTRSDRLVVECEYTHSKGTSKEYLTPVLSRVSVVSKAGAPKSPFIGDGMGEVGEYVGTGSPLDGPNAAQLGTRA